MNFSRFLIGFVFILSLLVIGLVAGMLLGSYFVPKDAGLAGGAIVLGYGVLGAGILIVLGIVLMRVLDRKPYLRLVWIAGISALLAFGWLSWRYYQEHKDVERTQSPDLRPTTEPAQNDGG